MPFVTTPDGTEIFYRDWGSGRPVVLSHGWPLNSAGWQSQALFLADHGYRVVVHDRRGHGRSPRTRGGNDMDHYAADLAAVINTLDLRNVTLAGFSTGSEEVARYMGEYGTDRVAQAVLIAAGTPSPRWQEDPGPAPGEPAEFDVPTLVISYPGASSDVTGTHGQRLNDDLLAFLDSYSGGEPLSTGPCLEKPRTSQPAP
jgi:pimeloyl-ACP methyl ester carboxylesterase